MNHGAFPHRQMFHFVTADSWGPSQMYGIRIYKRHAGETSHGAACSGSRASRGRRLVVPAGAVSPPGEVLQHGPTGAVVSSPPPQPTSPNDHPQTASASPPSSARGADADLAGTNNGGSTSSLPRQSAKQGTEGSGDRRRKAPPLEIDPSSYLFEDHPRYGSEMEPRFVERPSFRSSDGSSSGGSTLP